MTVPPEETKQPLTRRELRERERRAAAAAEAASSRRAATASVTQAGAMPVLTATQAIKIQADPDDAAGVRTSQLPVIIPEGSDRPLTRRELRALLAQQEAERASAETASDEVPAEPAGSAGVEAETSTSSEALIVLPTSTDDADAEPADDSDQSSTDRSDAPGTEEPTLDAALFSSVGTGSAGVVEEKATEITGSFEPPVEHLHITEELDNKAKVEADASFDDLIARGVSSTEAVTTTNALILPTAPVGPESDDVLVTGSIDMPRSLGSTGQHPNLYDSPEVDRYLDRIDREQAPAGSVPVSASSAISSHSPTPGMIAPQRKRGISAPIVLAVTAAVLLVGAIVLFVGGFVLNIF